MNKRYLLNTLAASVIGLTFAASSVFAQTTPVSPATPATSPTVGMAKAVDAKKLIGEDVKNAAGDKVGEINTVILDKSGQVKSVIVGVGGFLGVGEREVAMQWNDLKMSPAGDYIVANFTKDQVKAMPEYRYTDMKKRGTIFSD